jgi:hypothetical protein
MERPTCPNCGDLLREVVMHQLEVETWDVFFGGVVLGPSGIWETYCGDCFGDLSFEQEQGFRAYLASLPQPAPRSRLMPHISDRELFCKLQLQPGEAAEDNQRRWARAHRDRGPLRF